MSVFNLISLFGGLSLFLYGMRLMGDGLRSSSGNAFKNAMARVTKGPVRAFLLGLLVTAIIQSSTATIVITSGLVGAGVLSLDQSLGIILGANVGTTVTGQIIRLLDVDSSSSSILQLFTPSTLAPLAAILGILFIMVFKFKNSNTAGQIAMGFAILFTGLLSMTAAVSDLSGSETFVRMFTTLGRMPLLGFLSGFAVAFMLQSSSASVGILQAISMTGVLSFETVYPIILGIYMGDCVTTAIVCWIGAKADARRTGIVHVLINISQVILVFTVVTILHMSGALDSLWSKSLHSGGIADTHTIFKLGCAVALLPFTKQFANLSRRIVKDEPSIEDEHAKEFAYLDEAFFKSPGVALSEAFKAISAAVEVAINNVLIAIDVMTEYDPEKIALVNREEQFVDRMTDRASDYLTRLSDHITLSRDSVLVNYYLKCVSEFERISDLAVNLTENAQTLVDRGVSFSPMAVSELKVLKDAVTDIMEHSRIAFINGSYEEASHIEPIEEVVDDMVEQLKDFHLRRLRNGTCNVDSGFVFMEMLTNIERISDQCSNIGLATMGLFDPVINEMHHMYILQLHEGENQQYLDELRRASEKYLVRLKDTEAEMNN
ncbi:MAG: Na/Pi cotransporter family protein [Firmicutes bacterium]|nr:Na/Pi cotransporter family protein [Bacillota bacterium]